jgi:hypothetical protein
MNQFVYYEVFNFVVINSYNSVILSVIRGLGIGDLGIGPNPQSDAQSPLVLYNINSL